ncbi:MAG: TVP38/TMEM64 family protein [Deltaproteobacteria bacterium]|nr:TVP38/TMEM64 family protein [Deltaproteobacteria bacterium]
MTVCVAIILGTGLAIAHRLGITSYLDPERVQAELRTAGPWAPLVLVALMMTAAIFPVIPSLPLDAAAGRLFGPMLGTVYCVFGASVGAVLSFSIARTFGRSLVERVLRGHANFCTSCSDPVLTRMVLVARLLPFVSFDVVSYGAGLTKLSLARFTLATAVGMLPLTFAYNVFGAAVVENRFATIATGAVFVVLFFAVPRWIERYDFLSLRRFLVHFEPKAAEGDRAPVAPSASPGTR